MLSKNKIKLFFFINTFLFFPDAFLIRREILYNKAFIFLKSNFAFTIVEKYIRKEDKVYGFSF
jgi:hypothetical protein